jgi:cellulose biosynthesis protein BcsQ
MSNANETPIFVDMLMNTITDVEGSKSVLILLNNQLTKYDTRSSKSNTVIQEIHFYYEILLLGPSLRQFGF